MSRYKYILLIIFGVFIFGTASAQHYYQYSQYLFNGLSVNPAYAGSLDAFTGSVFYRNQWLGFEGSPGTQVLSVHTPLKAEYMAVGLLLDNDMLGVTRNTSIRVSYAYRLISDKGTLALGLQLGMKQMVSNLQDVKLVDSQDQAFGDEKVRGIIPSSGFGIYFYNNKFFAGLSVPEQFTTKSEIGNSNYKADHSFRNYNYCLIVGGEFAINKELSVKPSGLVRYTFASPVQPEINTQFIYLDQYLAGIGYRLNDAVLFHCQYKLNNQFSFGYAYDHSLSQLRLYNYGSHEIMIRYTLDYRVNVANPRFF
ncbi:MAG: hypothetical protein C0594_02765 [Marinilabiliales bacterium]|nr:MAG: hypothetical protein C0594_02765 [Marinilabiliales bacterium]